jgi:chromosome segregation protein
MKLTRLRLIGFKSFVEPSDVLIEPGLTGVVGPNGCGKSNVVEALRWVMGESSHKAMRAADMDQVIFSGTSGRPARNSAEVSLTIDNSERSAPAIFNDHDTLEVSRRIERESGSTYRVNGREVRARDVHLLFADASTGARSPALVHQGRIGEIIAAKPQARRRVLEEAAGVAGLHARRHEAELRLKAADHNLERLEDVIGQLAGQIDALKRQARQAVRYKAVAAQVRKAEASLFHLRHLAAKREVIDGERTRDLALRAVAERTTAQAEAATAQANASAEMPGLREADARAAAALQRLVAARDMLDREEARARERIAELERRLAHFSEDLARERKLDEDAQSALAQLVAEEEALAQAAQSAAERRRETADRIGTAELELADVERTFSERTNALAELVARRSQLERSLQDHAERLGRLQKQIAEVEDEAKRIELESRGGPDLLALAAEIGAAQASLAQSEIAAHDAEARHAAARSSFEAARGPLTDAERRVAQLEAEARTLTKILQSDVSSMWPPALDLITVEKGYEAALGAAFGDDLNAPIDPAAPERWGGAVLDPGDPPLPEGVIALAHLVAAPAELARRLAQIGVVERTDGARLAAILKPGQRLVSREGDLWRWDGYAASAHAPTAAARRLAEKNRLGEVRAALERAADDVAFRRERVVEAETDLRAATQMEAERRSALRQSQRASELAQAAHMAAEREQSRITARQSALVEAASRLAADLAEAERARSDAQAALAGLPFPAELEAQLAAVRTDLMQRRGALAEIRADAQLFAREAEHAELRLQAIVTERAKWNERREGSHTQVATIEARKSETEAEQATLAGMPAHFAAQRRNLIDEIEAAQANRRETSDLLAAGESALAAADQAARAALETMGTAREDAARGEERFEAAKRRLVEIAHEIVEVLEVEPERVAALAGFDDGASLPEVEAVESDLERLRRERERLGAVNLRAEEELREVEGQHTTLVTERDDLVEAIKRLRSGIGSLNREARERLTASFEVVNGHFQKLFTTLFGGGEAELKLIESDDPLEAGLDIMARPPGKRLQSLSLLSGGEQALTALALIFAVFLTNPAPICVLDEVDAPLDDHNVERFCDLMDEMARATATRFITITHNPITMARMTRLYGVTMAERGVSQLVSVDLEAAVRFREAS